MLALGRLTRYEPLTAATRVMQSPPVPVADDCFAHRGVAETAIAVAGDRGVVAGCCSLRMR
jgi:hypothetical protein